MWDDAFIEIRLHNLSSRVLIAIGGVFAILIIATAVTRALRWCYPERDFAELRQRINTWWYIVILFAGSLLLSRAAALVFLAFVSFLALKEYFTLIPTRRADRRVLFLAYLAIPFQYYWAYITWYGMFIIFIPVYMFLLLPVRMVLLQETKGFLNAVGTLQWGLMTAVFSLSHAAYLLVLGGPVQMTHVGNQSAESVGPALLVALVCLTELNDVAQYCWGCALGRRKIAPQVSPGKTFAGLIGGVATTTALAALLLPWLTMFDLSLAIGAGVLIGVSGFFGDLTISALKRDLGVKDSGATLPGHGGIFDRVDSLTYTAPLFFHFVYYFYY